MKKIFSILLSLALLVSLGVLTTAPVMAVTVPTISPTSANFNESNPTQLSVTVNWGDATLISGITAAGSASPANPILNTDYFVYDTLVVFTSSYLGTSLPDIGDTLILVINFDVGACILTVTATGTQPSINPTSRTWVLGSGASVNTTITWGCAVNNVTGIEDDDGDTLATPAGYTLGATNATTNSAVLTITNAYLAAELLVVGASTKLTIDFDCGNDATFTITCAAAPLPSVSPASIGYVLGSQSNVSTTITWGNATAITKIIDMSSISNPVTLVASTDYWVLGDDLVLRGSCTMSGWGGLECRLDGSSRTTRVMEITFNNAAATKVNLLVNSAGYTNPSLSSTALAYDLNRASDLTYLYVVALITFGTANNISAVVVNNATGAYYGNSYPAGCNRTLAPGSYLAGGDYYTAYVGAYASNAILFWKDTFLKQACNATSAGANLTALGDSITLSIYWAPWNPVYIPAPNLYGFTQVGTCPIDAYVYGYPYRYSPTTVTITATGTGASISPVKADFNLDAPANVTTTITWGPYTTSVADVMNGINALTNGVDYTVSGTTLTIASSYLSALGLAVDDQVVLTIVWDQGADAKFTITAIGTPLCFIATAVGEDDASLDILREFRDEVLRPNAPWLVSLYYKVSPSIAKVIAGNDVLKAAVKAGVDLIVDILS